MNQTTNRNGKGLLNLILNNRESQAPVNNRNDNDNNPINNNNKLVLNTQIQ